MGWRESSVSAHCGHGEECNCGHDEDAGVLCSGWPRDCSKLPAGSPSGVYIIQPTGLPPIMVYSEMNGADRAVIQRNHQSSAILWNESWSTYKYSFGNGHTEFGWAPSTSTRSPGRRSTIWVRFAIWGASNNMKFADYNLFSLGDESQGYQLRLGAHSGTAEDAMASKGTTTMHDNMKFSAKDRGQDTSSGNCATSSGAN